ncbi:hypothetical protein TNCV_2153191 [Trichonephila clavipes]|nr:hypothetical protein TNCV_2153191 [Trichonephila clavipes]
MDGLLSTTDLTCINPSIRNSMALGFKLITRYTYSIWKREAEDERTNLLQSVNEDNQKELVIDRLFVDVVKELEVKSRFLWKSMSHWWLVVDKVFAEADEGVKARSGFLWKYMPYQWLVKTWGKKKTKQMIYKVSEKYY